MVGIVGGIGPHAGVQLVKCILDQTDTNKDQDHIPIVLLSFPNQVADRTEFLLGKTNINPAFAIVEIIRKMELIGASVIGIACNTSHSHKIFDVLVKELIKIQSKIRLLNIITETIEFIKDKYPTVKKIGVLATNGTYITNTYHDPLLKKGFEVIIPDSEFQDDVIHRCIYDPIFGIKTKSNPISERAMQLLNKAIDFYKTKQVHAIILGCTEFSLAVQDERINNIIIIDSTKILARALIRETAPEKLKNIDQISKLQIV